MTRGFKKITVLPIHDNFLKFLPPTLSHLHPLQVGNCDSNLRFVVKEDENGKFRHEMVKPPVPISLYSFFTFFIRILHISF